MLHKLIVACTIITSSLTIITPNHRKLLAAHSDPAVADHDGFIIGYEQKETQIIFGNTNESAFNVKFGLGHVNAWWPEADRWDNTQCFIYQDNNRLIGGFLQQVSDIHSTEGKYTVKEDSSWGINGINASSYGYEAKSIGMCKAYNHNLKDWGNSHNFVFVKSGVIAGFKQIGSDCTARKEWIPLCHSWGIQQENREYKEVYLGRCRAWNPQYGEWGNSARYIYVNRKYLLPEEYKLYATMNEFDFGDDRDVKQLLSDNAQATIVDETKVSTTEKKGYKATGSHTTTGEETDSYSITWSGSLCVGTEVEAKVGVPLMAEAKTTVSASFTVGASNTHTTTRRRAVSHSQGFSFQPQEPGMYSCGLKVWEINNEQDPLSFTARVTLTAKDRDGGLYSGKVVYALLHLNGGFDMNITQIRDTCVVAVMRGKMRGRYAGKSEHFCKKLNNTAQ